MTRQTRLCASLRMHTLGSAAGLVRVADSAIHRRGMHGVRVTANWGVAVGAGEACVHSRLKVRLANVDAVVGFVFSLLVAVTGQTSGILRYRRGCQGPKDTQGR
ncbi:MAG: hypothetical protein ACHQLQ_04100 [Candidatus Acidiferrales bacterium]